jgi:hypothetical protein
VVEVRTVARTDVSIVEPTGTASLSLITCTGIWLPLLWDYTERLVVRAELISDETPAPPAGLATASQPSPMVTPPLRTLLDEPFDRSQGRWPDDPEGTAWVAGGTYYLYARQPGRFVAIRAPIPESLRDVVVRARFRKIGGPPGGGYGIIVRDQGPGPRDGINQGGRYYVLEVDDRGEVGIWRRELDRWITLLPWTPSDAVRLGGAPNELTVQATGERLSFWVNGIEVVSQANVVLPEGAVGIFVGGDLNGVVLDRFTVQVPT